MHHVTPPPKTCTASQMIFDLRRAPARFAFHESHLATGLSRLEPEHGDPLTALDHITLAIGNFYDSGHVAYIRGPLATLAALLDRLGRLEPAATIAGFALNFLTASTVPELTTAITHVRPRRGIPSPDLR